MADIRSIQDTVALNNGVKMPTLGLGTWRSADGAEVEQAVRDALDIGYRHIDTASFYKNEEGIGRALRASKLPREQIFVTTKVWNDAQRAGPGAVEKAFEESRSKLGLDVIDLYLVHWPVQGCFVRTWETMQKLLAAKKVRAIGVSNFLPHHLDQIKGQLVPAVNQIEWHVRLQSPELVKRCQKDGIVVEAWSPLMQGKIGQVPELLALAKQLGKTPAQVALRWGLQKGLVMIPKSVKRHRLEENAGLYDFKLTAEQVATLDKLDQNARIGPNPDAITF
ncbi:MAG: aldo/keto reductase [Tepidisphaeraceae bacterium]